MADKVKVIEIKTGPAIKSIQDLKDNITAYKDKLKGLDIGSKEYQQTLTSLQENQAALRNAMYSTTASIEQVQKAAIGLTADFSDMNAVIRETTAKLKDETTSYNEYVRVLAQLKEAWRSTTDANDRAKLGEAINDVNDKLKDMDKSVGVFGRNVGNYIGAVDHLTAGLSGMGAGAQKVIGPLKGVTTGLKTMSATPAVAILGLLASLLDSVIKAMKNTEGGVNALTASMAPFEAIGEAINDMLEAMGPAIAKVVGWFGKLTAAITGNNTAAAERLRIAKEQAALDASQRETTVKNAEAERDIAELRAKASEKEKYTAKERLGFLQEAGRLEEEIYLRSYEDAKKHYNIVKDRNALSSSSKEQLDEEAQAYADMLKAETAYYNQVRTINAGITRARKEEEKGARDAAKAVKESATAKIAAEKEYLSQLLGIVKDGSESQLKIQNEIAQKDYEKAVAEAKQKITNRQQLNKTLLTLQKALEIQQMKNQQEHDNAVLAEELRAIASRRDALQRGSVEYAQVEQEYARAAYDGLKKQMDETDAEFAARRIEAQKALIAANAGMQDALLKETVDGLNAQMAAVREGSVEQLALAIEVAKAKVEGMYQGAEESADEYNARRLAAEREVRVAEDALAEERVNQDRVILEQRMALLEEGSTEYLTLAMELKQFELDSLHQLEGESNEEFRLRELQAEKEYHDSKRALWQASLSIMQQAAGGISSILGSIADAYENNTELTKKEAQKAKNLRIASATIDMLQGAVTAYAGAQSLGVPMGPIVGAINAAAVVAAGLVNIAKIKATQLGGGDSSTTASVPAAAPATVSAPSVMPEVSQVRNITSATEEDRLNQMASDQRVYILDSDIQAKNEQRRVEIAETTF